MQCVRGTTAPLILSPTYVRHSNSGCYRFAEATFLRSYYTPLLIPVLLIGLKGRTKYMCCLPSAVPGCRLAALAPFVGPNGT